MKYCFLAFALLFTTLLSAQKKSTNIDSKAFKIQGAYLFDGGPGKNYFGFNMFNLGLMSIGDRKVKGIDLQGLSTVIPKEVLTKPYHSSLPKNERSLELSAYNTYEVLGNFKNGLYIGPMLSMGFLRKTDLPSTSSLVFNSSQSFLTVGAGVKADYYFALSKKVFFTVGTRITLLDLGFFRGKIENPALPIRQQRQSGLDFNFIRPQFPLMFGFSFLI